MDILVNCAMSMKVAKIFTGAAKAANKLTIYHHTLKNPRLNTNTVYKLSFKCQV